MQVKRQPEKIGSSSRTITLNKGYVTIVDAEDYESLNLYKWRIAKSHNIIYAARRETRNSRTRIIKMHRQIMNTPVGLVVHHRNHDSLDNRKKNLRNYSPHIHKLLHKFG